MKQGISSSDVGGGFGKDEQWMRVDQIRRFAHIDT